MDKHSFKQQVSFVPTFFLPVRVDYVPQFHVECGLNRTDDYLAAGNDYLTLENDLLFEELPFTLDSFNQA